MSITASTASGVLICEHVFAMVVCVLYPRFELVAALGGRRELLASPVALAPEAGHEQKVGETSAAAETYGVVRGMRVGEALSRCPGLRLVPPDPQGVRELWREVLDRLEAIGAAVESDRAGVAFFAAGGLEGLYGGDVQGVVGQVRRALGRGVRVAAAPCRFAAHAAALQARPRRSRAVVVGQDEAPGFLAPLPVGLLRSRPELQALPEVLDRLGIRTLGELAALPRVRWPSGSATRACWRSTSPPAGTPSSSRGGRTSR